jgi:cytochrome c
MVAAAFVLLLLLVSAVEASERLATDLGCYNCHGEPPRRNIRSFKELRADYASYRGQPEAIARLVDKMHHGGLFSHVAAHERLTEEQAQALVRWLVEGR